jgi:hypothetical protein
MGNRARDVVPPKPPTESVPPTVVPRKSVSTAGVSPCSSVASSSLRQVMPASTMACSGVMAWIRSSALMSMTMPPATWLCPNVLKALPRQATRMLCR